MIDPRTVRIGISNFSEGRKGNPPDAVEPGDLTPDGILPCFVLSVNFIYTSRLQAERLRIACLS